VTKIFSTPLVTGKKGWRPPRLIPARDTRADHVILFYMLFLASNFQCCMIGCHSNGCTCGYISFSVHAVCMDG